MVKRASYFTTSERAKLSYWANKAKTAQAQIELAYAAKYHEVLPTEFKLNISASTDRRFRNRSDYHKALKSYQALVNISQGKTRKGTARKRPLSGAEAMRKKKIAAERYQAKIDVEAWRPFLSEEDFVQLVNNHLQASKVQGYKLPPPITYGKVLTYLQTHTMTLKLKQDLSGALDQVRRGYEYVERYAAIGHQQSN